MKTIFLITLSFFASVAMGQSLKDSLFSGKLKNPLQKAEVAKDSARQAAKDSAVLTDKQNESAPSVTGVSGSTNAGIGVEKLDETMPDSLNQLYYAKQKNWKRWIDQQTLILNQLANDSRKVKKGDYTIEIEYEIGLNGRIKTKSVSSYPENEFLVEQAKEIMSRTPVLAPPVYGDGKPRPLAAKQEIIVAKK